MPVNATRIFADVAPVSKDSFAWEVKLTNSTKKDDTEGELIFCRWFRHPKTGKPVYPRNGKVFAFRKKR